ncbi:translational activator of cytochrome c oxidase 1 [Phlebotomus papatasi]|uniref:translational activator of cytochrome c oxidase 1 n=1 Tax=Phlebotomus papatasi TaxID=29031 RepID=UPI0024837218|nr:translational activator of cytochrome c oxidase 1 [Phlebotomus papatasi]
MILGSLLLRNLASKVVTIRGIHTGSSNLAGHSKWANIRHIKAAKDGQKSLLFARFNRQIRLAIQEGKSPNPAMNTLLRQTIDVALKKQMPMASIQAAIKKASGQGAEFRRHVLEVKVVQNKVYVVIVLYTDTPAQAKMNLSTILRKVGGTFADLKHLFTETGMIVAIGQEKSPEKLLEDATEHAILAGAEDVDILDENEQLLNFTCAPAEIQRVRKELEDLNYEIESAEHVYIPQMYTILNEAEMTAYSKFREKLKTIDCIDDIFDNIEDASS